MADTPDDKKKWAKVASQQKSQTQAKLEEDHRLQQQMMNAAIVYSDDPMVAPPQPKNQPPKPKPPWVEKFLKKLTSEKVASEGDEDPGCFFDDAKQTLVFSGPKGLKMLASFLKDNPDKKFDMSTKDKHSAKDALREMKDLGIDILKNMRKMTMDGQTYEGEGLSKKIGELIGPPRPTPNASRY